MIARPIQCPYCDKCYGEHTKDCTRDDGWRKKREQERRERRRLAEVDAGIPFESSKKEQER